MTAEMEARRTAAAAVLADFMHAISAAAWDKPPDFMMWSLRLRDHLVQVLDGLGQADEAEDGTEPYCTTCGQWAGMFVGMDGWHHFRGDPAPGGKRTLYDAGHVAVIGWARPVLLAPAELGTVLDALEVAAEYRRYRASLTCEACATHPAELCEDHRADLDRADECGALAEALRGQS